MKKKIIITLLIIIIILIALCYFNYINKTYNVRVVGFHVSNYEVDGYYPIIQEVITEFKTKGKCTINDELKNHNIDYADLSKAYVWDENAKEVILNENEKRKNNNINYEFANEFEEISWNTVINKDLNLLIEVKQ